MIIQKKTITTRDKIQIRATVYKPDHFNAKTILINAEFGVTQDRYADLANFLASQGFEVYTYDYRGIGESAISAMKSIRTSIVQWGELDYGAMILEAHEGNSKGRLIVMGHGLGAELIGFTPKSAFVHQFIFVGSWTPYWKIFSGSLRLKKLFYSYLLIPAIGKLRGTLPSTLIGATELLPYGVAVQLAKWGRNENFLYQAFPERKKIFQSLRQAALVYSFEHDDVNNEETLTSLYSHYPNLRIRHVHIKAHEVSVDRVDRFAFLMSSPQNSLWKETLDWINEKEVALKPGWHGKKEKKGIFSIMRG